MSNDLRDRSQLTRGLNRSREGRTEEQAGATKEDPLTPMRERVQEEYVTPSHVLPDQALNRLQEARKFKQQG